MLSAAWLAITSRAGRYLAAIGATLAILFAAYSRGRTDAAAKRDRDRLNEIKKAREVEDEVDRLGGDDLDRRIGKWMRD